MAVNSSNTNPLVEPAIIPETFVSGHARLELLGEGIMRITMHSLQASAYNDEVERMVVAKYVGHKNGMVDMAKAILLAAGAEREAPLEVFQSVQHTVQ